MRLQDSKFMVSALDSVLERGIAHPNGVKSDGKLLKMIDGKLVPMVGRPVDVVTEPSVTLKESVTQKAITEPMSNAERQKAYRQRNAAKNRVDGKNASKTT